MTNRSHSYGFTLIETLFAAAVFTMLTGFATWAVISGMRAQEFDRHVREAQTSTRNALNRLTDEMRSATVIPTSGLGRTLIPSGVLFPDSYGLEANYPASGPFGADYPVGRVEKVGNDSYYYSQNRLIFTRPATADTSSEFVAGRLSQYVYIEYMIPANKPNVIWRRICQMGSSGGATQNTYPGHYYDAANKQWLIDGDYFDEGSGVTSSQTENWVVAKLPGDDDYYTLQVAHSRYVNPVTGIPSQEPRYYTNYDRNLYTVTLKATVFRRGYNKKIDNALKSEVELKSQVRLQSGI